MTFLKVFLIMNAVFFLLSMASVRLRFSYYDTLHMKISYLFFSYTLLPQKEKKKAKKIRDFQIGRASCRERV